jgi:hypothetical protein
MSLDVQFNVVNSNLSIVAGGRYSLADLSSVFDRATAEIESSNQKGVILDVSKIAGTIPLMDMFMLGEHCSKVWKPAIKIAIVFPEVGVYNFFENVARNRGVQIAVVPNHDAAVQWLG